MCWSELVILEMHLSDWGPLLLCLIGFTSSTCMRLLWAFELFSCRNVRTLGSHLESDVSGQFTADRKQGQNRLFDRQKLVQLSQRVCSSMLTGEMSCTLVVLFLIKLLHSAFRFSRYSRCVLFLKAVDLNLNITNIMNNTKQNWTFLEQ